MNIKIDKGISVPEEDDDVPRKMKYPWLLIKPGESFAVDISLDVARMQARRAGIRYDRKFKAARRKGEVRVWRIK